MFYKACDRTARKNDIRDWLEFLAADEGVPISRACANRLAIKFKQGLFDPELVPVTMWADRTGETAVRNVLREQRAA